jgi:hypothetical protein
VIASQYTCSGITDFPDSLNTLFYFIFLSCLMFDGARDGVDGLLQAGRLWVQILMKSLNLSKLCNPSSRPC